MADNKKPRKQAFTASFFLKMLRQLPETIDRDALCMLINDMAPQERRMVAKHPELANFRYEGSLDFQAKCVRAHLEELSDWLRIHGREVDEDY